jgi:hypothetical protein
VIIENRIHTEMKSRLNSADACLHSVPSSLPAVSKFKSEKTQNCFAYSFFVWNIIVHIKGRTHIVSAGEQGS